jgi:hypothetical protein
MFSVNLRATHLEEAVVQVVIQFEDTTLVACGK